MSYEKNKFHKDNAHFLDKAYKNKASYTYIRGDTLYIAGTDNLTDVYDDITRVLPDHITSSLVESSRYKMVKPILNTNPQIKKLVAHSLAGNVGLRLQKEMPERDFDVTTYGAPVVGYWSGRNTRYKHPGDPVSILDMGAKNVPLLTTDPFALHSYKGYTYNFDTHDIEPVSQAEQSIKIPYNVNRTSLNNQYRIA